MEGDVIMGKAVPLLSTAHAYVMCLWFANIMACISAGVIYDVLCPAEQQIPDNYFHREIFQGNLHLPIRKSILD